MSRYPERARNRTISQKINNRFFNCLFHWNHCLFFARRRIMKKNEVQGSRHHGKMTYVSKLVLYISYALLIFFNEPVWSRYNTISYYKLLIISQEIVCNTRVLSVFTNSRKLYTLDCVSSFQTFPRTSKNHLPPLYRSIQLYWFFKIKLGILTTY